MDTLMKKHTVKELKKALETLPRELDTIYKNTMHRIEHAEDDSNKAKRILW